VRPSRDAVDAIGLRSASKTMVTAERSRAMSTGAPGVTAAGDMPAESICAARADKAAGMSFALDRLICCAVRKHSTPTAVAVTAIPAQIPTSRLVDPNRQRGPPDASDTSTPIRAPLGRPPQTARTTLAWSQSGGNTVWYSTPERRLSSSSTAICSCQPSA